MRRLHRIAALFALGALACAPAPPPSAPADDRVALRAVASIEVLAMVARELGGERIEVTTLLPPGASPHTFEARPSSLRSVARADWILRVGGAFDPWAERLVAGAGNAPLVTHVLDAPGLELLPQAAGSYGRHEHDGDPHVWLDPLRVRDALVPQLHAVLVELDPAGASHYDARARVLRRELSELDAEVRSLLARSPRRFVAFHPAWRYFAKRYGLEEVGVVEMIPGEAPSPRALSELVRGARRAGVRTLWIEQQLPALAARVAAEELDAELRWVDPLGDPRDPKRARYAALLRHNAAAIAGERP